MKLTDDILTQIGIKNPLHRMQLINTRDDLIAQQEQDTAVRDTDSPVMPKPSSPTLSFVTPQHSPKVSSNVLMFWHSESCTMLLCAGLTANSWQLDLALGSLQD